MFTYSWRSWYSSMMSDIRSVLCAMKLSKFVSPSSVASWISAITPWTAVVTCGALLLLRMHACNNSSKEPVVSLLKWWWLLLLLLLLWWWWWWKLNRLNTCVDSKVPGKYVMVGRSSLVVDDVYRLYTGVDRDSVGI